MSIRTSQVLFGVAGARCIWSRPAAESSAKRSWGCESNQPTAGPERSSGGIGPCWWWEREGRKGGREGWRVKRRGKKPITLLSPSLTFSFPAQACYSSLCRDWGDERNQKSLNYTYCLSLHTLVTERQPGNVYKQRYLSGCVSALRQYTNNLRSLLDILEKALPPISWPIEPWQHNINQVEKKQLLYLIVPPCGYNSPRVYMKETVTLVSDSGLLPGHQRLSVHPSHTLHDYQSVITSSTLSLTPRW